MILRLPVIAAAVAALSLCARAAERNIWPFWVERVDDAAQRREWQAAGPFAFGRVQPGEEVSGFRPFYLRMEQGDRVRSAALYPFFTWETRPDVSAFSFFQLINTRRTAETDGTDDRRFDIWPVYFSRDSGDPETTYRALMPIAGTVKYRLGFERLTWRAFPLYAQSKKGEMITTFTPWPIVRHIGGEGHHGFEVWPIYGSRTREGVYRKQFALWPLLYKHETGLDQPVPDLKVGALPFFTRETGPGYASATYAWPFFGYTHRTEPSRYDETRYFWPFLVQGRGEHKHVNRWAPFYTHSNVKGYDKTWVLWPLWRRAQWNDDDKNISQQRDQLLYFAWWSLEQRSLSNPDAAPATKRHLWPFYSAWDNGAGRRQVQVFSPFEVFFPTNEHVRHLWTPLVAVWRYDERGADDRSWSLLWHAATWKQSAAGCEFHLGPLFSWKRGPQTARVALGRGLVGLERGEHGRGWRPFLFRFSPAMEKKALARAPASP
jgi:hypothetical protein